MLLRANAICHCRKTHLRSRNPSRHRPCTQSLKKVNVDNSESNNNRSNKIQRLKLDWLRNSTWTQATTQNIMLQKSWKKAQKSFLKLDLKLFSRFDIDKARTKIYSFRTLLKRILKLAFLSRPMTVPPRELLKIVQRRTFNNIFLQQCLLTSSCSSVK